MLPNIEESVVVELELLVPPNIEDGVVPKFELLVPPNSDVAEPGFAPLMPPNIVEDGEENDDEPNNFPPLPKAGDEPNEKVAGVLLAGGLEESTEDGLSS